MCADTATALCYKGGRDACLPLAMLASGLHIAACLPAAMDTFSMQCCPPAGQPSPYRQGNCLPFPPFTGRMALGYLPERLLHARGTPRIAFLPLMSGLMAATCLGLAFAHLPALYPLSALAGFAFGEWLGAVWWFLLGVDGAVSRAALAVAACHLKLP